MSAAGLVSTPFVAQSQGARRNQEDSFKIVPLAEEQSYLVLVADGMGGEAGGSIASKTAVDTFAAAFQAGRQEPDMPRRLRLALEAANQALLDIVEERPELEGMGTTLVAVATGPFGAYYASVGDSLLWQVSGRSLKRINADHSMRGALAEMVGRGEMRAETAARHPQRNQLRSALGQEDLDLIDCPDEPIALGRAPMLLIATDGIETLTEKAIHDIILDGRGDPQRTAHDLLAAIAEREEPRQDNVTICIWQPKAVAAAAAAAGRKRPAWLLPAMAGALAMLLVVLALYVRFPEIFREKPPVENGPQPAPRVQPAPPQPPPVPQKGNGEPSAMPSAEGGATEAGPAGPAARTPPNPRPRPVPRSRPSDPSPTVVDEQIREEVQPPLSGTPPHRPDPRPPAGGVRPKPPSADPQQRGD
jgi:serine/threonine protein phosphatase PrpC